MKAFLILMAAIIISVSTIVGQEKKGFIVDPDGYSNVRETANAQSKIIAKVIDGEMFKYLESDSSWFIVETFNGMKGFMHKSRIKEFKIDKVFCFNPNFTELFLYRKDGKVISVCGIPALEIKEFKCYSGLAVYDALNDKKLIEFIVGQYQTFEFKEGNIIIKEYATIPSNSKFEVSFIPYSINKILFAGERIVVQQNAPFYEFPKLTELEINQQIEFFKNQTLQKNDYYKFINIALVLALNDPIKGQDFLLNLEKYLNIRFDGEFGEKYNDVLEIYAINIIE